MGQLRITERSMLFCCLHEQLDTRRRNTFRYCILGNENTQQTSIVKDKKL